MENLLWIIAGLLFLLPISVRAEDDLKLLARNIAEEYDIDEQTLFNLVQNESRWVPDAIGDGGTSYGLVQINCKYLPLHCENANDPEFALRFAAQTIKYDTAWKYFTSCSCIQGLKSWGVKVKGNASNLIPNTAPFVGAVALFRYGNVHHAALITAIYADHFVVKETNYSPCAKTIRKVDFDDPRITGYWTNK